MEQPCIKFIIDRNGKIFGEVEGVKGPSCDPLLKKVAKKLGKVVEEDHKPEFYQEEQQDVLQNIPS